MLSRKLVSTRATSITTHRIVVTKRSFSTTDQDTTSNSYLLHKYSYPRKAKGDANTLLSSIKHLKVTRGGGTDLNNSNLAIATIKFDRATKGNALNMQTFLDLQNSFKYIAADNAIRVAILTGSTSAFCTGMDLEVFGEMNKLVANETCEGRKREGLSHLIQFFQDTVSAPEVISPVPVIAAVSGHCIGGAVDIITACDLRYCTKNAKFSIKETDLAMVADIGTLQRLPRLIGDAQARELAYTGRVFDGLEAERLGLVLKAFDSEEAMLLEVHSVASQIASKSPLTIRGLKKTLLYARDNTVPQALLQVNMLNSSVLFSDDLKAAMVGAMTKKTPMFEP